MIVSNDVRQPAVRCAILDNDDVPARYLTGALSPTEAEQFEDHMLLCERCQHTVQLGAAIRTVAPPPAPKSRRAPWLVTAVAAAAALAGIMLVQPRQQLRHLGAVVEPPVYSGAEVRSADAPNARFDRGMLLYNARDFDGAATELQSALESGAAVPPTAFFLGAAQLMRDETRPAIEAFTRVVAAGDSPYSIEARYYRAKAYLRESDGVRAVPDLEAVAAAAHPLSQEARSLLMQVRR